MEFTRFAIDDLTRLLSYFPVVGLIGPRQVGKTTLAFQYDRLMETNALHLDLQNPAHLAKLADPLAFFKDNEHRLVILDEIHRAPQLLGVIRGIVDERKRAGRRTGQFLLLGSAALTLLKEGAENLTGRMGFLELTPFHFLEIADTGDVNLLRHWVQGGFPDSYWTREPGQSYAWRQAYIRSYLEREINFFQPRLFTPALEQFWTMLAHNQGGLFNASVYARALGVSGTSVARYLDLFTSLFLVRQLQPFAANLGKRLVRMPKVYVRDSGILHALLNIRDFEALSGHPVRGGSWEGFVIDNLLAVLPSDWKPYFYRTSNGAEIDLLLDDGQGHRKAIEIKASTAPKMERGFHAACDALAIEERYVVYTGTDTYPLGRNVLALPLSGMMKRLHQAVAIAA